MLIRIIVRTSLLFFFIVSQVSSPTLPLLYLGVDYIIIILKIKIIINKKITIHFFFVNLQIENLYKTDITTWNTIPKEKSPKLLALL